MKAVILAAGVGSRLGSVTKTIPKPMIEIHGKPILLHNINLCRKANVTDIYINLHHLPNVIKDYFGDGSDFGVKINYNYEQDLLGTAGALLPFKNELGNNPFYVIYGDNYIDFDLSELKLFNKEMNGDISILFHWKNDIRYSGTAEFNSFNQIKIFNEKPTTFSKKNDWANAGIYYINNNKIFNLINNKDDFGFNLFPKCLKIGYKLFGCRKQIKLTSIDTLDSLTASSKKYIINK